MILDFTDKSVLVTGGCSGVGLGIARAFASCGAQVTVADLQIDEAKEKELAQIPGILRAVKLDVSDPESVSVVFEELDGIDVLINNAGIYPTCDFFSMTPEIWQHMIDVDLNSVFYCTQAAARKMRKQKNGGSIINITTIDHNHPSAEHAHYCAAKAGAHSLTLSCATELGKYGIRVNAVAPGLVNRPGLQTSWPDGYQRFTGKAPVSLVPGADDIANACVFLASDYARCISGIELPVDSGILASAPY